MAQKSRKNARRNPRAPRDPNRWMIKAPGELRMAIVTYPRSVPGGVSLTKDVELVRASLLYADEVELVSLGAVVMAGIVELSSNDANILSLMGALDDETLERMGVNNLPPNWRRLLPAMSALLNTSILGDLGHKQMDELRRRLDDFRGTANEMFARSGGEDLIPALDEGILKVSSSGLNEGGDVNAALQRWLDLLKNLLRDTRTRLLLDDEIGDLVRSMVDEGQVELGKLALKHAGEAAVGSGLIARLPAFPQAPTDELLCLRRDLHNPLARYRSAVSRLADRLAFRSFDPESAAEIDDLWTSEVAPALAEMQEGFAEHGLVREIARTIGTDLKTIITAGAGATIFIGLDQFSSVSNWIAKAAAVAGPAAQAVASAAAKRREATRSLKQRELFYLYEVNRALSAVR